MARQGGAIAGAVVLTGLGLTIGGFALLSSERRRLDPRAVTVFEDTACDEGAWAVVIRDGGRRLCLSAEDARELLRRDSPFEYQCTVPEPSPPAAPAEPPRGPTAVDGPVARNGAAR